MKLEVSQIDDTDNPWIESQTGPLYEAVSWSFCSAHSAGPPPSVFCFGCGSEPGDDCNSFHLRAGSSRSDSWICFHRLLHLVEWTVHVNNGCKGSDSKIIDCEGLRMKAIQRGILIKDSPSTGNCPAAGHVNINAFYCSDTKDPVC